MASKLILTQEVTGLGSAGDIVDVRDGYARNYLVPRGFATPWTKGGEKQVEAIREARKARAIANLEDAQALAETLQSTPVRLEVTAGESGRLFGAVKPADIANAVETAGLGNIDKRSVTVPKAIKATGNHQAQARVHEDVVATIALQVVAEGKKKKKK